MVDTADEVREEAPPDEFDCSGTDWTELAPGATDLSPEDGNVWLICDLEDPAFGNTMDLRGQSFSLR